MRNARKIKKLLAIMLLTVSMIIGSACGKSTKNATETIGITTTTTTHPSSGIGVTMPMTN